MSNWYKRGSDVWSAPRKFDYFVGQKASLGAGKENRRVNLSAVAVGMSSPVHQYKIAARGRNPLLFQHLKRTKVNKRCVNIAFNIYNFSLSSILRFFENGVNIVRIIILLLKSNTLINTFSKSLNGAALKVIMLMPELKLIRTLNNVIQIKSGVSIRLPTA